MSITIIFLLTPPKVSYPSLELVHKQAPTVVCRLLAVHSRATCEPLGMQGLGKEQQEKNNEKEIDPTRSLCTTVLQNEVFIFKK